MTTVHVRSVKSYSLVHLLKFDVAYVTTMSRSQSVAKLAMTLLSFPYVLQARQHLTGGFFLNFVATNEES